MEGVSSNCLFTNPLFSLKKFQTIKLWCEQRKTTVSATGSLIARTWSGGSRTTSSWNTASTTAISTARSLTPSEPSSTRARPASWTRRRSHSKSSETVPSLCHSSSSWCQCWKIFFSSALTTEQVKPVACTIKIF